MHGIVLSYVVLTAILFLLASIAYIHADLGVHGGCPLIEGPFDIEALPEYSQSVYWSLMCATLGVYCSLWKLLSPSAVSVSQRPCVLSVRRFRIRIVGGKLRVVILGLSKCLLVLAYRCSPQLAHTRGRYPTPDAFENTDAPVRRLLERPPLLQYGNLECFGVEGILRGLLGRSSFSMKSKHCTVH